MTSLKNSYGSYKSEELNRVGLKQPFIDIGHNFFINQMVGLPLTKMTTFTHFIDCKRCFSTFSDFSQPWFVSEKYLNLCSQCTASFPFHSFRQWLLYDIIYPACISRWGDDFLHIIENFDVTFITKHRSSKRDNSIRCKWIVGDVGGSSENLKEVWGNVSFTKKPLNIYYLSEQIIMITEPTTINGIF